MALLSMAMPFTAKAQDKVEASAGVDLVSGYVWRGQDLGGVSLQPSASIAYKGFSLGAWGSVGIESSDTKEFDLILGYSTGGFSVSVTDYWYNVTGDGVTAKYFQYGAHNAANSHLFEAQIGYDFGPVAINWYTNFAGDDGVDKDGDRAYSSYISVAAPFTLGGLDWTAEIGATPWATDFYGANGFPDAPYIIIGEPFDVRFEQRVLHVLELGLSDNSFNLFHTLNNLRLDNLRFTICLSVCVNHRFFILET